MGEMEELQERGICNIDDLNNWIKCIRKNRFPDGQLWWRGQSDFRWLLKPGIFRYEDRDTKKYEYNIIHRFLNNAPIRYPKSLPIDNPPHIYAIMQHYGLPTRLLDWTESPLLACYFAVEKVKLALRDDDEEENTDAALFALAPGSLKSYFEERFGEERGYIYTMDDEQIKPILDDVFTKEGKPIHSFYPIMPVQLDIRMLVQMTGFTIHGDRTAIEEYPDYAHFCIKIKIPGGKSISDEGIITSPKRGLKKELFSYGIERGNIFPDLDSLSRELREDMSFGN